MAGFWDMTTATAFTTGISWARWRPSSTHRTMTILNVLSRKSTNSGGSKMRKTKVTLRTGSTEEFFNRLRERAKKLDRGETLPAGIPINFEDPIGLLKVITSERVRL